MTESYMPGTSNCGNCLYFDPKGQVVGLCRAGLPLATLPTMNQHGHWPTVRGDDWCGNWKQGKVATPS